MDITGTWQVEKKDDFEATTRMRGIYQSWNGGNVVINGFSGLFLANEFTGIGVPDAFANLSSNIQLQLEILRDGDKYTFKEKIMLPLSEHTVTLGKSFETVNWLGKKIKGIVGKEDNKIVEKSKEADVPSTTTFQSADGKKLIRTRDYTTSKCTLTYTKV